MSKKSFDIAPFPDSLPLQSPSRGGRTWTILKNEKKTGNCDILSICEFHRLRPQIFKIMFCTTRVRAGPRNKFPKYFSLNIFGKNLARRRRKFSDFWKPFEGFLKENAKEKAYFPKKRTFGDNDFLSFSQISFSHFLIFSISSVRIRWLPVCYVHLKISHTINCTKITSCSPSRKMLECESMMCEL